MNEEPRNDSPLNGLPTASGLEFICWDEESMATGVPALDAEAREIIRHLNHLYHAHRSGLEIRDIYKMLKFLCRHIELHFKHEEQVMEERLCPIRRENRRAHIDFLVRFQDRVVNFTLEHDTDQAATDIENMLARWLSSHISQIDVALRDCPPNPGIIAGNSAK